MVNHEVIDRIDNGEFTMYDKFLYGGIGYGYICLPKNGLRVFLSIIFPPFAIILKHLQLSDNFPYITMDGLLNLVNNFNDVVYAILLTFLFWVPGVVYALQQIKVLNSEMETDNETFKNTYGINPEELDEEMVEEFFQKIRKSKRYNL